MTILSDIHRILTLDCRESSRLLSESMDRKLRPAERIALRLHSIGCWSCRRLRRQLIFLRQIARRFEESCEAPSASSPPVSALSNDAKERMKLALRRERDGLSDS